MSRKIANYKTKNSRFKCKIFCRHRLVKLQFSPQGLFFIKMFRSFEVTINCEERLNFFVSVHWAEALLGVFIFAFYKFE